MELTSRILSYRFNFVNLSKSWQTWLQIALSSDCISSILMKCWLTLTGVQSTLARNRGPA